MVYLTQEQYLAKLQRNMATPEGQEITTFKVSTKVIFKID